MVNYDKLWFSVHYQSKCYQYELVFWKFTFKQTCGPCTNYKGQVRFFLENLSLGNIRNRADSVGLGLFIFKELTDVSSALDLFLTGTTASLLDIVPLSNQIVVAKPLQKRFEPWLDVVFDNIENILPRTLVLYSLTLTLVKI